VKGGGVPGVDRADFSLQRFTCVEVDGGLLQVNETGGLVLR
jgi:hypothetical protein